MEPEAFDDTKTRTADLPNDAKELSETTVFPKTQEPDSLRQRPEAPTSCFSFEVKPNAYIQCSEPKPVLSSLPAVAEVFSGFVKLELFPVSGLLGATAVLSIRCTKLELAC